jgi:hypothetical protein
MYECMEDIPRPAEGRRAPAAPYASSYHFPIDLASRSLYRLCFADFIEEIAQMSIGNEY